MASTAGPDEVRAWAVENGYPDAAGKRGRLKGEIINKYNEANKSRPYASGKAPKTIKVTAMVPNSKGGKTPRTRHVVAAEVRDAAADAGVKVSPTGKLSEAVLTAFVAGTLADLATEVTV